MGRRTSLRERAGVIDRVAGRTALVTGAGSGIGRAISLELAAHGARVLLAGRHDSSLKAVEAAIIAAGAGSCRWEVCDVSEPDSVASLAQNVADEEVSIVVNNAGVAGPVASLANIEPTEWDAVFAVNVRGVYLVCASFVPLMVARGAGDVVNIASVTGKRPLAGRSPYAASKLAVIGLTITLAHEVGPFGVNVNSLSPGPVRGERMTRNFEREAERSAISVEAAESNFVSRSALNRMVEADEVGAALVAMLQMPGLCAADIDLSAGMVAR